MSLSDDFEFVVPQVRQTRPQAMVKFFHKEVPHEAKSLEAGRPIHVLVEHVSIINPGSRDEYVGPVNDEIKAQYPEQYRRWQETEKNVVEGTPLTQWPQIDRATAADLRALNIVTVEQLANLPDIAVQKLGMGGLDLRKRAKAFIDYAKDTAIVAQQQAKIEQLERDNEMMKKQFADLQALVDAREKNRK